MAYGTRGNAESRLTEDTGREIDANVKALASAPPTGAATSAKQDAQTALLTTIDADTSKIPTDPAREGGNLKTISDQVSADGLKVRSPDATKFLTTEASAADISVMFQTDGATSCKVDRVEIWVRRRAA